jgi:DNA/RNA-binding domain of Phe-tRNA-synthetase-like protein
MLTIDATDGWKNTHPGGKVGLLEISGVNNLQPSPRLIERKREIEAHLRETYQGFSRQELLALPMMTAYDQYYKKFNKTYHVQLQLESIVWKGKNLPDVSPAVDANFMAEVETLVLTAGHDVAKLHAPIIIDASREGDQMLLMNGSLKIIRAGDMIMRDRDGISCSIIYGQDNRSPISPATRHVLYVAYAPEGVPAELVSEQLSKIEEYIRLFSPIAYVEQRSLLA